VGFYVAIFNDAGMFNPILCLQTFQDRLQAAHPEEKTTSGRKNSTDQNQDDFMIPLLLPRGGKAFYRLLLSFALPGSEKGFA